MQFIRITRPYLFATVLMLTACGSATVTPEQLTPTSADLPSTPTSTLTETPTVATLTQAAEAIATTPSMTSTQDYRTRPVAGIVTPADPDIEIGATLDALRGVPSNIDAWDRYVLRYVNLLIPVPPGWIIREWPVPEEYPIYYTVSVLPDFYRDSQASLLPEISLTVYRDPIGESLNAWFLAHSSSEVFDSTQIADPSVYFYEVTAAREARVGEVPALRFTRDVLETDSTTMLVVNRQTVATLSANVFGLSDLQRIYELMLTGVAFAD